MLRARRILASFKVQRVNRLHDAPLTLYLNKAKQILPQGVGVGYHTFKLAFELFASDMKHDMKLMAVTKDMDKEHDMKLMAVIKDMDMKLMAVTKDMDMKLMAVTNDYELKIRLITAKNHKALSRSSQRYLLERFFGEVHQLVVNGHYDGYQVAQIELVGAKKGKMSPINRLLLRSDVLTATWGELGISSSLKFPNIGTELIYGFLSDSIHNHSDCTFLGSGADADYLLFFKFLSARYNIKFDVYDDDLATLAEDQDGIASDAAQKDQLS